jgi:hypothetical protein
MCFSCEDKGWFTECSDCLKNEPENASLHIKISEAEMPVTINIYEGELEDNVLYGSASYIGTVYNISVALNKKYTVTSTYIIDGNTYTAVDSATPRVRFTETQCEEACYFVYDRELDLRLKYTARAK